MLVSLKNTLCCLLLILSCFLLSSEKAHAFQPHPLSRQDSALVDQYTKKFEEWKIRGDLKEASRFLNQIAMIYWEHNQYREAISYYERSKKDNEDIGNENGVAMINNNLAMIYSDLMDYKKSLEFFDKTLSARRSAKERVGITSALINRSVVLNNLQRYKDAANSLEEALSLSRENYDIEQMKSCYLMLAETFEKAGDAKNSLKYFDLYRQMHKKKQDEENAKTREELENAQLKSMLAEIKQRNTELEVASKNAVIAEKDKQITEVSTEKAQLLNSLSRSELEVKILKQEADLQEQFAKQEHERRERRERESNIIRIFASLLFLFVLTVILLLWRSNKQKIKNNELLAEHNTAILEQKGHIEEQNQELNTQKEYLEETLQQLKKTQNKLIESEKMAAIGNLVAGVAHEINTPVGVGITLASDMMDKTEIFADLYKSSNMKRSDLEKFLQNTFEAGKLILSNLQRTGRLIQNFRQVSVDESADTKHSFELVSYVKDVIASLKPKYRDRPIEILLKGDDKITVKSYPGVYAQIITNLFVNALKYAFPDDKEGNLEIDLYLRNDLITIEIKDDGIGIPVQIQNRIFEPFFTTDKHQGTGLGLHITYNLVKQKLSGNIDFRSIPSQGTSFTITIPLNH